MRISELIEELRKIQEEYPGEEFDVLIDTSDDERPLLLARRVYVGSGWDIVITAEEE